MLAGPNRFAPTNLTVSVNTTVLWFNDTGNTHTVNSNDGSGELNSGSIGARKTFSHRFESAGTFSYVCAIHPSMTGTITVEP